mmetsp:Transcript_4120/g.13573  ORF Transcript_4120/g.13573 Transcript_4120/m.13573 type:complete len:327 (+) Transcript_4120:1397-2377(+)
MPARSAPFLRALNLSTGEALTSFRRSSGMQEAHASVHVRPSSMTSPDPLAWAQAAQAEAASNREYGRRVTRTASASAGSPGWEGSALPAPAAASHSSEAEQPSLCKCAATPPSRRSQSVTLTPPPCRLTTAYEKKTGLHSMSDPRRLKSHAIWSNELRMRLPAPASRTAAATRRSLEHAGSPEKASGCGLTGCADKGGRAAPHAASTRLVSMSDRGSGRAAAQSAAREMVTRVGSTPTGPGRLGASLASHSSTSGTPGSFSFINTHSVPASCLAACTKYRPSVHRSAWVGVTSAVPADPVKPVSHSLRWSSLATYSEECASPDGTR